MKNFLLILIASLFVVSCNNSAKETEVNNSNTQEQLQGAWYTTTLEANGQVIYTKEHPEALSSFVFKDDKVKLIQMGNHSENGGTYKVSNDTIYIFDIITSQRVMAIKIDSLSETNFDITVLDNQNANSTSKCKFI